MLNTLKSDKPKPDDPDAKIINKRDSKLNIKYDTWADIATHPQLHWNGVWVSYKEEVYDITKFIESRLASVELISRVVIKLWWALELLLNLTGHFFQSRVFDGMYIMLEVFFVLLGLEIRLQKIFIWRCRWLILMITIRPFKLKLNLLSD